MLLAGMQGIPKEQYEAARTDGASALQQFVHITLPLLIPVISVTLMINLIWTFSDFTIVHVMTAGGPYGTSELVSTYIYKLAFVEWQLGKAVSVPVIQLPFLIIIILLVSRMMTKGRNST